MKTTQELQHLAWCDALGDHLSYYPEHLEPQEIVERIRNGELTDDNDSDNDIVIWEPFEDYPNEWVADRIEDGYRSALIGYQFVTRQEQ